MPYPSNPRVLLAGRPALCGCVFAQDLVLDENMRARPGPQAPVEPWARERGCFQPQKNLIKFRSLPGPVVSHQQPSIATGQPAPFSQPKWHKSHNESLWLIAQVIKWLLPTSHCSHHANRHRGLVHLLALLPWGHRPLTFVPPAPALLHLHVLAPANASTRHPSFLSCVGMEEASVKSRFNHRFFMEPSLREPSLLWALVPSSL